MPRHLSPALPTARARAQVLLVGIEAHVCVLQTALDLLEKGLEVHLLVDAIGSQREHDRAVALQRMSQAGARLHALPRAASSALRWHSAGHELPRCCHHCRRVPLHERDGAVPAHKRCQVARVQDHLRAGQGGRAPALPQLPVEPMMAQLLACVSVHFNWRLACMSATSLRTTRSTFQCGYSSCASPMP